MSDNFDAYSTPPKSENSRQYVKHSMLKPEREDHFPNVLRIVDGPECQRYYVAWILCDDAVKRPFIVKNEHEGAGILNEIIGDRDNYYRGGILETIKDDNGQKSYKWNSLEDPEIMDYVRFNNDRATGDKGWSTKVSYIMNDIDRCDEVITDEKTKQKKVINYCKENKHTKALDVGQQIFDAIKKVRKMQGPLHDYDIVIERSGSGLTDTKYTAQKPGPVDIPGLVFGPLTEEELAYEKWDLIKITKLTDANYILKNLRDKISRIGKVMGIDFIAKLERQAAIEKELWGKTAESEVAESEYDSSFNPSDFDKNIPIDVVDVRQPVQEERVPESRIPESQEEMEACPKCQALNPKSTMKCPKCSWTLLAPCGVCKTVFSTMSDTCPGCGAKYKVSVPK
jgi:ribosomal protein L40E